MEEIWIDVKDYIGLYQVSNWGRVRSVERYVESRNKWGKYMKHIKEKILSQVPNSDGYLYVNLSKNGVIEVKYIHKLVAKAFIPNTHGYEHIHHKDKNQLNNHVENLEWISKAEHEKMHASERAEQQSKVVYQLEDDDIVNIWVSVQEAAKVLRFDKGAISNCCNGKRKTHGGFAWSYNPLEIKKGEDFNLAII